VHDALNTIDRRFETYVPLADARRGSAADAAIAAATYRVLLATVPSQAAILAPIYAGRILALPPCPPAHAACVADGIAAGEAAAQAIVQLRANDGSATPHLPYTLAPGPGVYQPTPPNFLPPQFAGWARMETFTLVDGSQFRADPPAMFDLTSEEFARDFNEVKRVGRFDAELTGNRTHDQSNIALYWPAAGWNGPARLIAQSRGGDSWEKARLFALMNVALSDATVAVYDTKYTYNFWRPVTAIRAADTTGNPATSPDPSWLSFVLTPAYPDFTCGLTINAGAAAEILRRFYGTDDIAWTFTGAGITRSFSSLTQATDEAIDARVFGGMHFRTGCVRGVKQGAQVAHFVFNHELRELKGHGH
jgi:hypothetical protein